MIDVRLLFALKILRIDIILPDFVYTSILTKSRLGLYASVLVNLY